MGKMTGEHDAGMILKHMNNLKRRDLQSQLKNLLCYCMQMTSQTHSYRYTINSVLHIWQSVRTVMILCVIIMETFLYSYAFHGFHITVEGIRKHGVWGSHIYTFRLRQITCTDHNLY